MAEAQLAQEVSSDVPSEIPAEAANEDTNKNPTFRARQKPIVAALALTIAGATPFIMNMTTVFFVEAMAWTFLIWGLLSMYFHLIDYSTTYEVTEDSLILRSPFIPWRVKRVWFWDDINRLDVVVSRTEAKSEDVEMRIYYRTSDSPTIHREDVNYLNPELAKEVTTRASLKPKKGQAMQEFDTIPDAGKTTYIWQ